MRVQMTSAESAVMPERAMVDIHRPRARARTAGRAPTRGIRVRFVRRRRAPPASAIAATDEVQATATKVANAVSCTRSR